MLYLNYRSTRKECWHNVLAFVLLLTLADFLQSAQNALVKCHPLNRCLDRSYHVELFGNYSMHRLFKIMGIVFIVLMLTF